VEYRLGRNKSPRAATIGRRGFSGHALRSCTAGKHAPRTIVESRYPPDAKGPTLAELIQGNDPNITHLGSGEPRFARCSKTFVAASRKRPPRSIPLISCGQYFR